jgi:hypothetical protein
MTRIEDELLEARQKQLRKILGSIELGSSRQSQEFLSYAAEAAFQGRVHLEQTEIAERVLRRGKDFNPLDDASVRKLATLTRQRLEAYYAGPGADDPIVPTSRSFEKGRSLRQLRLLLRNRLYHHSTVPTAGSFLGSLCCCWQSLFQGLSGPVPRDRSTWCFVCTL